MLCLNFQDRNETIFIVKHVSSKLFERYSSFKMIVNNIESLMAYSELYLLSLHPQYCFRCCSKVHIRYPQVPEVECKHGVLILLSAEDEISCVESWFYICGLSLEFPGRVYKGPKPLKYEEHTNKNNNWFMQVITYFKMSNLGSHSCVTLDQVFQEFNAFRVVNIY